MTRTLSAPRRILAVLCGGFCGTIVRYLLGTLIQSSLGKGWPYDLVVINLTGACLLAFITALADATLWVGPTRRLFINVGLLGAYTTFSSLALDDVLLFTGGQWLPGLLYLLVSLGGGIIAVLVGDMLGQWCIARVRGARRATGQLAEPELHSAPVRQPSLERQDDPLQM